MLEEYAPLALHAVAAVLLAVIALGVTWFFGPKVQSRNKFGPYECGMDQMDSAHKPFAIKFYTVALLFMLFDVETVFLLPWALGFREYGFAALSAMAFFITFLGLGLWYVIRSGVFEWD